MSEFDATDSESHLKGLRPLDRAEGSQHVLVDVALSLVNQTNDNGTGGKQLHVGQVQQDF